MLELRSHPSRRTFSSPGTYTSTAQSIRTWSHGSLEDYEWFWRVVESGHRVLVTDRLFGWHHHRTGLSRLAAEYRRSARGCAYFIRAHRESPFAQKRMAQAIVLPLTAFGILLGVVGAMLMGYTRPALEAVVGLGIFALAFFSAREFLRTRTVESFAYPVPALALGVNYTASLVANLIRTSRMHVVPATYEVPVLDEKAPPRHRALLQRLIHPLTFILAFQAGVALSLIWSNTGFGDELNYQWVGTTLINHILHGTVWPTQYVHTTLSGLPFFYPPLGAIADRLGGLAGARLLSMFFMLCCTGFVFGAAKRIFGQTSALCAAALWVTFSPTLQLSAFATYDAMSVSLTACAAWLVTRTGTSGKRGEMVACSGVVLAAAEATAYSGIAMIPVVVLFALAVWSSDMGFKQAAACAAWCAGVAAATFALIMTVCKTWPGIVTTVLARQVNGMAYAPVSHVLHDSWTYSGFIAILAFIGAVYALNSGERVFGIQVSYLTAVAFVIPIAQAHETTAVSLRKHLAYGGIFAAMAAGYGLSRLAKSLPARRWAAMACCGAFFIAPAVDGVQQADNWYHTWPDQSSMQAKLEPLLSGHPVIAIDLGEDNYWCKYYYADLGSVWETNCIGASPQTVKTAQAKYIVLGYPSSVDPTDGLPANLLLSPKASQLQYLSFLGEENMSNSPKNPQLAQLTVALEASKSYRLIAVGPWNSDQSSAIYTIWQRVALPRAAAMKAGKP